MPVLVKTRFYSTSRGSQSGPCLCSVACSRGGHLALRLASTVHGFYASTHPFKYILGATKHGRSALWPCSHCVVPSPQQRGQVASSVQDAVRHHVPQALLLHRVILPTCTPAISYLGTTPMAFPLGWGLGSAREQLHCRFTMLLPVVTKKSVARQQTRELRKRHFFW